MTVSDGSSTSSCAAPAGAGRTTDGACLMARRDTAARRYAEAAFEVAQRDDSVATWRAELDAAASVVADEQVGRMLANPAVALETRTDMAESVLGKVVGKPVLNLIGLMLR